MTRKALFIDRDGVINNLVKYPSGWDSPQKTRDVKLVKDISKLINWANKNFILVIEITNQPAFAKGKLSFENLEKIEQKVHLLLNKKDAKIDKVYRCLHHPDAVIKKYKKVCNCRKPKTGLFIKAGKENSIDFKKSVFLGDKFTDYLAGESIGCKTFIYLHQDDEDDKVQKTYKLKTKDKSENLNELFEKIKEYLY